MASLPEEMLERIFANLEPIRIASARGIHFDNDDHMERKTLANICRSSQVCNRIAYPYLYRTIHLRAFSSRPRLLLRSLLMNPKLNAEVMQLRISGRYTWNKDPDRDLGRYFESPSDLKLTGLLQPTLRSLPLTTEVRNVLIEGVGHKLEDSEIACIAAICPFLEVLDLPVMQDLGASSLVQLIAHLHKTHVPSEYNMSQKPIAYESQQMTNDRNQSPLSRVLEVSLSRESVQGPRVVGELLTFLRLPKLKTFRAYQVDVVRNPPYSSLVTNSNSLQHLSITHSNTLQHLSITKHRLNINDASLASLLRGSPKLHTLTLQYVDKRYTGSPDFREIGQALNDWGRHLQVITLAASTHSEDWEFHPLGDISNLRSLRELNVPGVALFGQRSVQAPFGFQFMLHSVVDHLPKSLEKLDILMHTGYQGIADFSAAIRELWMDYRFAKLERILFDRLAWTEKLFQQPFWDLSDSTSTSVVLKRPM